MDVGIGPHVHPLDCQSLSAVPDKSDEIYSTIVKVLRVAGLSGNDLEASTRRFDTRRRCKQHGHRALERKSLEPKSLELKFLKFKCPEPKSLWSEFLEPGA